MLDHLKQADWGTPASPSERLITLEIDGRAVLRLPAEEAGPPGRLARWTP